MLANRYRKLVFLPSSISRINDCNISTQTISKPNLTLTKTQKSSNFIVYCNTQITENGRNGNLKQAESIFNSMPYKNTVSWTAMLTAYADNGQMGKARKVFDEMPDRKIASYNAMITAYIRNNCGAEEGWEVFANMPERNAVSYGAMITGFVQAGMLDKAEILYSQTPEEWRDPVCSNALIKGFLKMERLEEAVRIFESMMERDVVSWSSMVDGYCKMGRIADARNLFDKMQSRNVVTWTGMINGYMKMGCYDEAFDIFLDMRREDLVAVNSTTFTIMFEACGSQWRYHEGVQMHCLVLRMGFDSDVFLGNSIITMYCKFGHTDAARKVFCMMSKKDVVSWNSLIAGYVQNEKIEEACQIFEKTPKKDIFSWTIMITGYCSIGRTKKSMDLFRLMPYKDDVVWTAVISGFVNNGEYEEAFCLYIEMLEKAMRPNPLTLSSILSASAGLATLHQGLQIHGQVLKMNMEFDLSIQNSLVSMYSKCGNIIDAYKIFTNISSPNVVSYNSMITAFAQNGSGEEALKLFSKMQKEGQAPNQITFLGVLSACTHVGLVEEGWNYFKEMESLYSIEPGLDHYACMVDLLGRAGLMDEAVAMVQSMPFEPHPGVWGALLGASKTHLHLDIAKLAAQYLIELEPNNATPYVVLSNLYYVAGRKNDGKQVIIARRSKGIKKSPGCSWIIVKDKVHLFHSRDQSHVDIDVMKAVLFTITKEMQLMDCQR